MRKKQTSEKTNTVALLALCFFWVGSVASALAVIYSVYVTSQKADSLASLERLNDQLTVKSGQLILEERAWAQYDRVERFAKGELEMEEASQENTIVIPLEN